MPERKRFTDPVVRGLPIPPPKRKDTYLDFDTPEYKTRIAVPGLELVVSYTGVKSFVLRKKVKGRTVAVTLGRHPSINVETARKLAREASYDMAGGVNPNQKKKAERVANVTLSQCFEDYISRRQLAETTLSNYNTVMDKYLSNWKSKPLKMISGDMIESKHRQLSKNSESNANKTMRILRSLFNFAGGIYKDSEGRSLFPDNPVAQLSALGIWNKEKPRRNIIGVKDFPAWFSSVLNPNGGGLSETVSDLLVFILLTGLRRREASRLQWEEVDMRNRSFKVSETKNDEELLLPLSDYLYDLLKRREKASKSKYVFPGLDTLKPLQEPKKQVEKIRQASGVMFTIHDLRRTFITVAESCEIAPYAIKALVNHKLPKARSRDVTEDYVQIEMERLRGPMQKITDNVLKKAKLKETEVIELKKNLS